MSTDYAGRVERARARMEQLGIGLLYLSPGANAQYLTGWPRRQPNFGNVNYPGGWVNGVLVGLKRGPVFAVPRMVADFDLLTSPNMDIRVLADRDDPSTFVEHLFAEFEPRLGAIAVENRAWAELVIGIRRVKPDVELRLASEALTQLRQVKSDEEIVHLTAAGAIVDQTMADAIDFLAPDAGQTELDVASEIDRLMVHYGAQGPSFETNVWQMGPHDERPLMKASDRPLKRGNALCFDFGSALDGYCYDFGRAVHLGEPSAEYRRVYDLVMASARVGIEALQAGERTAEQVNALARAVIDDAGEGSGFRHRLGHGIGLDVHEPPYLDRGDTTVLERNMTFTVEPSLFYPGRLGARTEDVVVVGGREGGRLLTSYRRNLQVVD